MGKSRVGKTQIMKKYAKKNKGYIHVKDDLTEVDVIPVVYTLLPSTVTLKGFYNQILKGLEAKRFEKQDVDSIKSRVLRLLKEQKVEMLILDELDYLLASTYVNKKQVMELVKDLVNETGVCVVCVGTPAIEELRTLNDQLVGRFPPVTIPWFKECDDAFIELLEEIEGKLDLEKPLGLANRNSAWPYLLHELSGGLIGWLKPILREAFDIVGVFDSKFSDFSILDKIDGKVLHQARENVIGQLTEEEINNFLERSD